MDAIQLKRIPLFEDVPDDDLKVITAFATSDEVAEGTCVVREGDFANHFMAIEEGTAEVRKGDDVVSKLGPGEIFGEMGLLEKEKRSASIVATSRLKLIKIERWELQRMKKVLPQVYKRIEDLAAERHSS